MTTGTPAASSPHLVVENQIDVICDAFERQWIAGHRPRIEEYLSQVREPDRLPLLLELFRVELEHRVEQDEEISLEEYCHRFPEARDALVKLKDVPQLRVPINAKKHFGRFELIKHVGSGAYGSVWKALDPSLDRLVALKIPRIAELDPRDRSDFNREARAAARLNHPNIVSVHDLGTAEATTFIVSDFIAGRSLRDLIAENNFTPRAAAHLCVKIADALHHAHERGIVHRDLKPANILVDEEGEPHITDFGLAKSISGEATLTMDGQIVGTPAYMSPEQARGRSSLVDRRSDVYSLGTVLYELLTGEAPFRGDQASVLRAVLNDQPQALRQVRNSVSRDLETICIKAMGKEKQRRYPTAQEMSADLQRWLRGEAVLARRPSPAVRLWRWTRRHPAIAISILLAALALGSTFAAVMLARREAAVYRDVTIATEPNGARMAFAPLNSTTGVPIPGAAIRPRGRSPIHVRLKPGDYLVVAALDDGRFHEVYRHVPRRDEPPPEPKNHLNWHEMPRGDVVLPSIAIPSQDVTDGMVLVANSDGRNFYLDRTEFTNQQYYDDVGEGIWPEGEGPESSAHAMCVDYDEAVAYAEAVGRRLPSGHEYLYAATNGGTTEFSWGSEDPANEKIAEFGNVGSYDLDRTTSSEPILGLCSHVAEWTSPSADAFLDSADLFSPGFRSVRGGDANVVKGNADVTARSRNPHGHFLLFRKERGPGLGFRCGRSVKPQFLD